MANRGIGLISPVATGGVAHYVNTENTFSSGKLFSFRNNGTEKFYIGHDGGAQFEGAVTIKGDLVVDGTTITINSTTLTVDDKNIELGSVASPSNSTADGGGITLKGDSDKTIQWSNSNTSWTFNQHLFPSADSALNLGSNTVRWATGYFDAIVSAAITGPLTGNASTATLAAAATALADARTIHGVSFDGTANIDLSEVVADTVGAMFSGNTETGITATYQDGDNTIDLVVGTLNQNTTGSAATLTTPRAINGVNFDGSAAITVTADANTLSNTTLKSTVVTSSLQSVGTLTSLTLSGNLDLQDDDKILLGTGDDLEIYHDGSNSIISETGTGGIKIFTAGVATSGFYKVGGEELATFEPDGPVTLYFDDAAKLATASGGVTVTGAVTTGSVNATANVEIDGDLTIAEYIYHKADTNTYQRFQTDAWTLRTNGADAITADSSQDVNIPNGGLAIGTTSSPETGLHISKTSSTGLGAQLTLDNPAAAAVGNAVEISFLTDTGADPQSTRNARILAECNNASNGAASLQFHTWDGSASAERMRIQQDGKVGINIDAVGTALLDPSSQMTVKGDVWSLTHSDGGFKVNNHTAGTTGGTLSFFKSRQGNYDPPSAAADDVVNGDTLFSVVGYGYSNSQFSESARMLAQVDGTFTSNQRPPGRFVFQTGVSNGAMTEAMRIDSSQDVNIPNGSLAIGTTTAPAGILDVKDGDTVIAPNSSADNVVISQKSGDCGISILSGNSNCIIAFGDEASADDGAINYIHADRQMSFKAADTSMLWLSSDGFYLGSNVGDNQFRTSSAGGGSTTMYIGNQSITTSSDRRLKTNIVDSSLDAVHALNQLRVTDFNWDDPSDTSFNNRNARGVWTGMIAQEVVEHLPFTVNAPRDEEKVIDYDSDSTWSIEPMAMCGVLVKAIQELSTRIQDLEAQLDG